MEGTPIRPLNPPRLNAEFSLSRIVIAEERKELLDALLSRGITRLESDALTVGEYACYECTELTEVNMPLVTSIGKAAFSNCTKMTSLSMPMLEEAGSNVFQGCSQLTKASLPLLTVAENYAFRDCVNLVSVDLHSLANVSAGAFWGCSQLTRVDLPAASQISAGAFRDCSLLDTVILRKEDAICTLSNTNAFNGTPIASGTGFVYVPTALVDSYKTAAVWSTYANQVRAIEDYPDITGTTE